MAAPALRQEAARTLLDTHPLPSGEAGWAREARARAEALVAGQGLPGRRDEYWRFTNPEPLTAAAARTSVRASAPRSPSHLSRTLPPSETPTAYRGRPGWAARTRRSTQSISALSPE